MCAGRFYSVLYDFLLHEFKNFVYMTIDTIRKDVKKGIGFSSRRFWFISYDLSASLAFSLICLFRFIQFTTLHRRKRTIMASLLTLPIQVVYLILDNLQPADLLISAFNVSSRLNSMIESYHPYQVNDQIFVSLRGYFDGFFAIATYVLHFRFPEPDFRIVNLDTLVSIDRWTIPPND